ncbi:putative invertase inhibitor [Mercurialis annua]|uniref:putative invertase inhibitor n=1 Tax=Mercurialis annua TaxID=3986 RepID=UPI002160D315|nr:putative invertase inhibitor [Mercurialis annua]
MKNYFMYILLFNLAIIFLCFNYTMSINSINDICKKASNIDPNFTYQFCVSFLASNPKSKSANLEGLVLISIKLTISNSTNIISHISQLLKHKKMDPYINGALKDCLEHYSNANSELHEAISDLTKSKKDYSKANIDVSAAMDLSTTCEDGFKEKKGVVSPLKKENKMFFQMTAIILSFMKLMHI